MRKIKLYAICLVATVAMCGCSKYDDTALKNDVNNLKTQVEELKSWCNTVNGQISALQGIVTALQNNDYVTGVTPILEGTKEIGYTITFTKSKAITIMHGKNGVTPIIGVKKDVDGNYYWTIKIGDGAATWLTDENDQKIRTTGDIGADGNSPVMSVATFEGRLYWQIDGKWLLDGDNKVPATGDAGSQGDAIFAQNGIDYTTDSFNVIFTLADGTKITLPKSSTVTIGFDSYDTFYCSDVDNLITIVLPASLKESDYNAILATIINENGTSTDIKTRSASTNTWGVELIKPTFNNGTLVAGSAKVKLILPQDKTNYKAILKVTLYDSKGKEHSINRLVWFKADNNANVIDNTTGSLSTKITDAAAIKELSIIGSVSEEDFNFIRTNLTTMEVLDLSRSSIASLPDKAMAFYDSDNTKLKTIILPDGLTTIGNSAFAKCVNLQEINIPKSTRTLGKWMFEGCTSLEEVSIPEGVTKIVESAFYGASIKKITIPSSVTTIDSYAFKLCNSLVSITIPSTVTSMGMNVLSECSNLESADILANVDTLQNNFFMHCPKLQNVKLSTSINTLGSNSFCNTGLTEYIIPNHITHINEGAFCENTKLHTVTLPAGVNVKWNTFYKCNKLENVTIPEGVTELGGEMFRDCIALKSIVLPSTLLSIRDRAFQGCSALISLTCEANIVPTLLNHNTGQNYNLHFIGINDSCVLKRPAGSDYSTWATYFKGGISDL